jgi:hypothetical protein
LISIQEYNLETGENKYPIPFFEKNMDEYKGDLGIKSIAFNEYNRNTVYVGTFSGHIKVMYQFKSIIFLNISFAV